MLIVLVLSRLGAGKYRDWPYGGRKTWRLDESEILRLSREGYGVRTDGSNLGAEIDARTELHHRSLFHGSSKYSRANRSARRHSPRHRLLGRLSFLDRLGYVANGLREG